jgi:hypothetical protein
MAVNTYTTKTKKKLTKFTIFGLELVFVNRVIKTQSQTILSKLLSFDGHPLDKPSFSYSYSSKKKEETKASTINDCL